MRLAFILLFLFLTLTEVFIALFVRDSFIRPYFGDVLVVIVIYAFIRMFLPVRPLPLLPVAVFLFSVLVEIGQYIGIVDILGLSCVTEEGEELGVVTDVRNLSSDVYTIEKAGKSILFPAFSMV